MVHTGRTLAPPPPPSQRPRCQFGDVPGCPNGELCDEILGPRVHFSLAAVGLSLIRQADSPGADCRLANCGKQQKYGICI